MYQTELWIFYIIIHFFIHLVRRTVNHLQFLFCIYQLCVGHVHIVQDTLRTRPYIKRSVYFSDQCWNRACFCAQLWCPTPKAPQALLGAKKTGFSVGENEKGLAVLPKGTITALVPTLSWVWSNCLGIYTYIQLAHAGPPRPYIHLVIYCHTILALTPTAIPFLFTTEPQVHTHHAMVRHQSSHKFPCSYPAANSWL